MWGFWSTQSVRRISAYHGLRHRWAGRMISRTDGDYEVYGAPECARGAPIGDLFKSAAWFSIMLIAILSLLPGDEMVRTGLPTKLEHVAAYAGSAAVATVAYGHRHGSMRIIGFFWAYAGILEYFQRFSPGPTPLYLGFRGVGVWRALLRGRPLLGAKAVRFLDELVSWDGRLAIGIAHHPIELHRQRRHVGHQSG